MIIKKVVTKSFVPWFWIDGLTSTEFIIRLNQDLDCKTGIKSDSGKKEFFLLALRCITSP